MTSDTPDPLAARRSPFGDIDVAIVQRYWLAAAVVVLAAIIRSYVWLTCDVSWLLTVSERLLAGARPYVDFSEPNPPASILIYLPAVWIAQRVDDSPEFVLSLMVFMGVLLCLWTTGRILSAGGLLRPGGKPTLAALACILLLILPGKVFAQREHVALLAILPMLAVYAVRASGAPVGALFACLAGLGGGVAVAIKPYLGFALVLPLPYVAWCWKSHRLDLRALIFAPEHVTAALVLLVYGVVIFWLFPEYLHHTLPLVLALYVPTRSPLLNMIGNPSVILVAIGLIAALVTEEFRTPSNRVVTLAVFGFTAALILQGKGWPYHGYPAIALLMLGLCVVLASRVSEFRSRPKTTRSLSIEFVFAAIMLAGIYALASSWFLVDPVRAETVSEVSRLAPAHPRIVSLSGGPELAFPLTRILQGTLIGRAPFQWISHNAQVLLSSQNPDPETRRQIESYERMDREELADTIRSGRPDVILIKDQAVEAEALSHPEIAAILRPYREVETIYGTEIWLPRKMPKLRSR